MTIGSFLKKNKIREYIKEYEMLKKGDRVLLGLSGGPDSVCLLFVLLALKEEYDLNIQAVHINHMIRGKEADEDQLFVENLCKEQGIMCKSLRIDIPARASQSGRSVEEEARMARYEAFFDEEVDKIAIAHNANDNAETVLFHMARGAGLDGMCGIAPKRDKIIRPLLQVPKADIEELLKDMGQGYCIDKTNLGTEYDRNKIRHLIIPELEQVNEGALLHITQMTEALQRAQSYIKAQTTEILDANRDEEGLKTQCLKGLDPFIRETVLKEYLSEFMPDRKDVSAVHLQAVEKALNASGEQYVSLPHKRVAICSYDHLVIKEEGQNPESEEDLTKRVNYRQFPREEGAMYPEKTYTKWFDCDKIKDKLVVRNRAEGDYLVINSSGGTKSVKDYFISEKIPRHKRDTIPLVCDGNHVLWVIGYRISEYYKVTENTTRILEISFLEEN